MLDNLFEIELASKILLGARYRLRDMSPLEYIYKAINMQITTLDKKSNEFLALKEYIENTAESPVDIQAIYTIQRKGEADRMSKWKSLDNHFLLFHGSKLQNFISILYQGLKIAPPEAPTTGWAYGKGIYFADTFGKSMGYCTGSTKLMLMCEVALGKMKELYRAEYMESPPEGFNSVKGMGERGPDFSKSIVLPNGVIIPSGSMIPYPPVPEAIAATLGYFSRIGRNEYIIYDTSQARMRYLIQFK